MKNIVFIIGILLCFAFQYAETEDSEIEKLYIKALNSRFDLLLSSGEKYIELNKFTTVIKDSMSSSGVYKFLNSEELIRITLKKKRALFVYRMSHKEISSDTIDVNFSLLKMTAKRKIHWNKGLRFKEVEYKLNCVRTRGYEPDLRFIKDIDTNKWLLIENRFIIKEN